MEGTINPPNEQLRAARERASWSLDRVAFALNLPVRTIEYLEEADYDQLHGDAFVIGYIRSYANLFSLDADQLVADFHACKSRAVGQHEPASGGEVANAGHHPQQGSSRQQTNSDKTYKIGYGLAAVITLMASMTMLTPREIKPENTSGLSTITVETSVGTTVIHSLDELPADNPTSELLPTVTWQDQQKDSSHALNQEQKRKILPSEHGAETQNPQLSFQFSADCWVEIVDGDQQIIFADLQKADQKLELSGKPPFHITLGYAPGVALSYNGQPVDIDTSSANIAKLVLGNS